MPLNPLHFNTWPAEACDLADSADEDSTDTPAASPAALPITSPDPSPAAAAAPPSPADCPAPSAPRLPELIAAMALEGTALRWDPARGWYEVCHSDSDIQSL